MSRNTQTPEFQSFALAWCILSFVSVIVGVILKVTTVFTKFKHTGDYFILFGIFSFVAFFLCTVIYFMLSGKNRLPANLILLYVIFSISLIFGGLLAAFFLVPYGMTIFITGLVLFGLFWVGVVYFQVVHRQE